MLTFGTVGGWPSRRMQVPAGRYSPARTPRLDRQFAERRRVPDEQRLCGCRSYSLAPAPLELSAAWWNDGTGTVDGGANSAVRIFALLSSVSCTAPGFCMATVGEPRPPSWNDGTGRSGRSCEHEPTSPAVRGVFMHGVSCRTSKDCFAVGEYYGGYGEYTQIEHWDGAHWATSRARTSPPRWPSSELAGIHATAGTACIAVGTLGVQSPRARPTHGGPSPRNGT